MVYVTHHAYDRNTIGGGHVTIAVGEQLDRVGSMLFYNGKPVCIYRSLAGKQHFAIDDDGLGLERGALTYALAYEPRERRGGITGDVQQRFTDEELDILSTRWAEYIKPDIDMLLFNDRFFEESPEVLRQIAESVHIDPVKGGDCCV